MKSFLVVALILLAGCTAAPQDEPSPDAATSQPPQSTAPRSLPASPPSVAEGGGPDPALEGETAAALQPPRVQPLTRADFESRLPSGAGCTFTSAAGENLLVAVVGAGADERARGVIRFEDSVRILCSTRAGGLNALGEGGTLADEGGLSAFVRVGAGAGAGVREGDTQIARPASLLIAVEGGGSVTFQGRWVCGS